MKTSLLSLLVLTGLAYSLFSTPTAKAQTYLDLAGLSPYTHYKTFETEHFRFIYQDGYWNFTARAAEHFEHAHAILSPILKWQPRFKTDILVADNEDNANGFTMPALRVGIVLIATPPEGWFSTSYSDDWIKLLVFHEYTHFLNIDATRGFIEVARWFFGDVVRPNGLWPTWMLEGLAVYYETRTSKMGRGRSPYYDSILRAYLADNRLGTESNRGITLDRVNGADPYFPGGEIPYLFGYHLWDEFSKDHMLNKDTDAAMGEVSYRSSGRIPYFIEGNLENVMDKNWSDYWDTFILDSKARLGKQIDHVKKAGETKSELLTHSQYAAYLGAISPDGQWLAYTESSLDDRARLVLLNLKTKLTRRLEEKVLGVGMSFTPDSKNLVFSSLVRTGTYSLLSDLMIYDLEKDQTSTLSVGLRAKDPALSPDGTQVAFVVSDKGTNIIQTAKLSNDHGKWSLTEIKTLYRPKEFTILATPKFVSNDLVIYSQQEIGKTQSDLVETSVSTGATRTVFADGAINRTPSVQNGNLYFVSDQSGIENVSVIPVKGGTVRSLTNVITGATLPVVGTDGTLYASLLTSDGYEIARFLDAKTMPLNDKIGSTSAQAPLPEALKEPTLHFDRENSTDYSPWSSLAPRQWAPVALLTYNSQAGLSQLGTILGFDTTGKHQYFGFLGYNYKPKTLDGGFSYTYYGFRPTINLSANSVTTDIAGIGFVSTYRTSQNVTLDLSYPIRFTHSHFTPSVYGFVERNKIYDLSTRSVLTTDDFEYSKPLVPGLGASFSFSDSESSRLGFMQETGNDFSLAAEDRIDTGEYQVIKYLAAYAHYFDLGNHWVFEPQAKYLASTHPTGFDHSYARYQGRNSSNIYDEGTGVSINRISSRGYTDFLRLKRQITVTSLDLNFPIAKPFVGFGTWPVFIKQVHGFIFGENTYMTSAIGSHSDFLPSFGGGLSMDTQLLIRVPLTFSLEVQNGTRKDYGGDTTVFLAIQGGSLF